MSSQWEELHHLIYHINIVKVKHTDQVDTHRHQHVQCAKLKISPHYICPLLQNPVKKPTQSQKGYHFDDSSHGHPRVSKAKHEELQVTPVIPEPISSIVYPPRMHSLQDMCFDY